MRSVANLSRLLLILTVTVTTLGVSVDTAQAHRYRRARPNITELAIATPDLSTLVDAVVKAGLADTLANDGPFTVFAPTNDAFADAGIDPAHVDVATLTAVLLDHVVPGRFSAFQLRRLARRGETLETLGGLRLAFENRPLEVNDLGIVAGNNRASNGIVHLIDGVLLEPGPTVVDRAIANPDLTTLVEAVVKAELVDTLAADGPFTVFAPSNRAFDDFGIDPAAVDASVLVDVLLDHVVPGTYTAADLRRLARRGETLRAIGGLELSFERFPLEVNELRIIDRNDAATNGIVHVINGVLLPPPDQTIVDVASATPELSDLVRAVVRTGLADTLANSGPFTVFAPTNTAFAKLGVDVETADVDVLRDILLDHVLMGRFEADDLVDAARGGAHLTTLGTLRLSFFEHPFKVNGIRINTADVDASNGVIHLIDGVLLQH
ncbi:MAG: fasciclin domain-containing protein [Sandaracinaceae bacterium]